MCTHLGLFCPLNDLTPLLCSFSSSSLSCSVVQFGLYYYHHTTYLQISIFIFHISFHHVFSTYQCLYIRSTFITDIIELDLAFYLAWSSLCLMRSVMGVPVLGWSTEWSSEGGWGGRGQPVSRDQLSGLTSWCFTLPGMKVWRSPSDLGGEISYFLENKMVWALPATTWISLSSGCLVSSRGERRLETKIWVVGVFTATDVSSLLDSLSRQTYERNRFRYRHRQVHKHISIFLHL